jgi:hypothetical protein
VTTDRLVRRNDSTSDNGCCAAAVTGEPSVSASVTIIGRHRIDQFPVWVTVNVWPATVSVPTRVLPLLFLDTSKVIVPLPVLAAPVLTVIHESFETDVHAQPAVVVTETGPPDPGVSSKVWFVGSIEYEQIASCDTVNVFVAMLIVPSRAAPEFAPTV